MKQLTVPFLSLGKDEPLINISDKLDNLQKHAIDTAPWPAYQYKPQVDFTIAYSDHAICLKYYVSEKFARAVYAQPNEPVYQESCVEFFISFEDEKGYYNLEFNCAGTCLLGFGRERNDRKLLAEEDIRLIKSLSVIKPAVRADANIGWELSIVIPFKVFHYHQIKTLKGKLCRANFYKCGDDLPDPHFLVWNNIVADRPDFHLPQFFGSAQFR